MAASLRRRRGAAAGPPPRRRRRAPTAEPRSLIMVLPWIVLGAALLRQAGALPVLEPCTAAANAAAEVAPPGRWGLCTGGSPLSLRGSNYIRLGGSKVPGCTGYHTTFDAGVYNRTRYIGAFEAMRARGYNIARVFLDERIGCGIGGAANATIPLDPEWLDRLAQFVSDAEARGLYTMVTMVYAPFNAFFKNLTDAIPQAAEWGAGGWNTNFLTARGHAAYEKYASLLAAGLKARLAPGAQHAVVISLQNEYFLQGDLYPFSSHNTTVDSLADGVSYNMALPKDRQQAADANTNAWAAKLRAAIRTHLPATLVTAGVFTFHAVGKAGPNGLLFPGCDPAHPPADPEVHVDCRFPARPLKLSKSGLDFLDVHICACSLPLKPLRLNHISRFVRRRACFCKYSGCLCRRG
jgi:hypothetical protein